MEGTLNPSRSYLRAMVAGIGCLSPDLFTSARCARRKGLPMNKASPPVPKQRPQRNNLIRNEDVVARALKQAQMFPTVDPRTAAVLFGVCEGTMYRSAREERFGVVKVGGRYRFPSRNILQAIGAAGLDDTSERAVEVA